MIYREIVVAPATKCSLMRPASGDMPMPATRWYSECEKLRKARLALGLSQADAGIIAGGGHNGFSRYENGVAEPVPAVWNLFHLLEKHPQLAAELPGVTVMPLSGGLQAGKKARGSLLIKGKPVKLLVEPKPPTGSHRLVTAKSKAKSDQSEPAKKVPARKSSSRRLV